MSIFLEWIKRLVGHQAGGALLPEGAERKMAADQIRANLLGEHGNISTRIQWNLAMQGFLFAGYAVAAAKLPEIGLERIAFIIPLVGTVSCAMTLVGIYAAYRSINASKRAWLSNEALFQLGEVRPFSEPVTSFLGRIPSFLGPSAVLGAWIYLMGGVP